MMMRQLKAKLSILIQSQSKEIKIEKTKKNRKFHNKPDKVQVVKIQTLTETDDESNKNKFRKKY